ncbi:MAG TPA: chromate transporter, partial [Candidatus Humimicrobiaceae bacterium]|nr:chromate transporter [Candidatus Humimicrobiaceae bacterium]
KMIYLQLLIVFFKIGLFSFGGGYGMIPLIEREIVIRGWLTGQELVSIISISEMTPGPIAINTATFIGYRIGGVPGAALATIGVVLPSLILILGIYILLSKYQQRQIIKDTIYGIRPIVLALIIHAVIFVAVNTYFKEGTGIRDLLNISTGSDFLEIINPVTIAITVVSLMVLFLTKIHPILVILAAGAIGVILHFIGVL